MNPEPASAGDTRTRAAAPRLKIFIQPFTQGFRPGLRLCRPAGLRSAVPGGLDPFLTPARGLDRGLSSSAPGALGLPMYAWMRRESRIRQHTSPALRDGNKIAQHGAPYRGPQRAPMLCSLGWLGAECWVG